MVFLLKVLTLLALVQPSWQYARNPRLQLHRFQIPSSGNVGAIGAATNKGFSSVTRSLASVKSQNIDTNRDSNLDAKAVTKEIMSFFNQPKNVELDRQFKERLSDNSFIAKLDGMHCITILFQSARTRRQARKLIPTKILVDKLKSWSREWTERDISTFVYGIRAVEGLDKSDGELIKFGAKKIAESQAKLTSRAIGNALYGLQDVTSDYEGIPELCSALAGKIESFEGDLNGQDIGIGLYGMQGLSADNESVRKLIDVVARRIKESEAELDAQAMSNALYGLQVNLFHTWCRFQSCLYNN